MEKLWIREVSADDLDSVAEIEEKCFPAAEAATRQVLKARIEAFSGCFFVAELEGELVGFINGCITNSPVIYDELFSATSQHVPDGENLTVFGLDVVPKYRRQGIAAMLMNHFIQSAKKAGRKKVILTCKEELVDYYQSFGYINDGISASTHGGAQWFDMTLDLHK